MVLGLGFALLLFSPVLGHLIRACAHVRTYFVKSKLFVDFWPFVDEKQHFRSLKMELLENMKIFR